jgi:5-methylcytosine-specific restriction protein A
MLASLKPTNKARVMDLVQAAGIDVSCWGEFKGGAKKAASNPKYCYEWAFVDDGNVVVLNLWHRDMEQSGEQIIHRINFRQRSFKARKDIWKLRDERLDSAIRKSVTDKLPIRVIVIEGQKRDVDSHDGKASSIKFRLLDPMCWTVTEYNQDTGECVLTRGGAVMIDQFILASTDAYKSPEKKHFSGSVFVRDAKVREYVLQRSKGKCEWCNTLGFAMANGAIYLETHHVIPLSEGGSDSANNVVALCPNHHREAHHGMNRAEMRKKLGKLDSTLKP